MKSEKSRKRKVPLALIGLLAVLIISGGVYIMAIQEKQESNKVLLKTTMGDITLQLYDDLPITTANFKKLVKEGFYDGVIFHRVMEGFMIQGGDHLGTGYGGPGYTIKDEFVKGHSNLRGTIAMANKGTPNSGGSQFFINLVDNTHLDWDKPPETSRHPVFGEVIDGMEVVDAIGQVETDSMNRPLEEVRIVKAELI